MNGDCYVKYVLPRKKCAVTHPSAIDKVVDKILLSFPGGLSIFEVQEEHFLRKWQSAIVGQRLAISTLNVVSTLDCCKNEMELYFKSST